MRLTLESFKEEHPQEVLWFNGHVIGTQGSYTYIVGREGTGKSYIASCMAAAVIRQGDTLCFSGWLPEGKAKVLLVDTEQSRYYEEDVYRRILQMLGYKEGEDCPLLVYEEAYKFSDEKLCQRIEEILKNEKDIGYVIIDNAGDLVEDVNSIPETRKTVREWLPRLCHDYGIHATVLMHENKSDHNGQGWQGSYFKKGCEAMFRVCREEKDNFSTVTFNNGKKRGSERPKEFYFFIDADGIPTPGKGDEVAEQCENISQTQHIEVVNIAFSGGAIFGYRALVEKISEAYQKVGLGASRKRIERRIVFLRQEKYIHYDRGHFFIEA